MVPKVYHAKLRYYADIIFVCFSLFLRAHKRSFTAKKVRNKKKKNRQRLKNGMLQTLQLLATKDSEIEQLRGKLKLKNIRGNFRKPKQVLQAESSCMQPMSILASLVKADASIYKANHYIRTNLSSIPM